VGRIRRTKRQRDGDVATCGFTRKSDQCPLCPPESDIVNLLRHVGKVLTTDNLPPNEYGAAV
jgi:hypothetical protein